MLHCRQFLRVFSADVPMEFLLHSMSEITVLHPAVGSWQTSHVLPSPSMEVNHKGPSAHDNRRRI